jgi:hypothetical protein
MLDFEDVSWLAYTAFANLVAVVLYFVEPISGTTLIPRTRRGTWLHMGRTTIQWLYFCLVCHEVLFELTWYVMIVQWSYKVTQCYLSDPTQPQYTRRPRSWDRLVSLTHHAVMVVGQSPPLVQLAKAGLEQSIQDYGPGMVLEPSAGGFASDPDPIKRCKARHAAVAGLHQRVREDAITQQRVVVIDREHVLCHCDQPTTEPLTWLLQDTVYADEKRIVLPSVVVHVDKSPPDQADVGKLTLKEADELAMERRNQETLMDIYARMGVVVVRQSNCLSDGHMHELVKMTLQHAKNFAAASGPLRPKSTKTGGFLMNLLTGTRTQYIGYANLFR